MRYSFSILILSLALKNVINATPLSGYKASRPRNTVSGIPGNATYDYVIVGGGTAGLAMAARLSEDPSVSIAVIEAGTYYELAGNSSQIPLFDSLWTGKDPSDTNPAIDWGFVTTPQAVREPFYFHNGNPKAFDLGKSASPFPMITNIF